MKQGCCGLLVVAQLAGAGFSVAQTNASPATLAASALTHPAIAVSPRSLNFASVAVGGTTNLTFTVQNLGAGTLTGEARVPAPFRIVGGSPYVLGSSQSHTITVQYGPKVAGLSMAAVHLTGGNGAKVTVAGLAVPAPAAAPAPPQNLRLIAER